MVGSKCCKVRLSNIDQPKDRPEQIKRSPSRGVIAQTVYHGPLLEANQDCYKIWYVSINDTTVANIYNDARENLTVVQMENPTRQKNRRIHKDLDAKTTEEEKKLAVAVTAAQNSADQHLVTCIASSPTEEKTVEVLVYEDLEQED